MSLDTENLCSCPERRPVKDYCEQCRTYICSDCHVAYHMDHESEVVDLAEKCTRYLADYQKLARTATLMADRRQIHIKNDSVDSLLNDLRGKLLSAKDNVNTEIKKHSAVLCEHVGRSPIVQELVRRKNSIVEKIDLSLLKSKVELEAMCRELLMSVYENRFESADRLLSEEKLKEYEEAINRLSECCDGDLDFIKELHKLKDTQVLYESDPCILFGLTKLMAPLRKPDRVMQYDSERGTINSFHVDIRRLYQTRVPEQFDLPFRFLSVEMGNNVYFNGGDDGRGGFSKSMYLYDELRGGLLSLAEMHEGRSKHAVVGVADKSQIYAIAGEDHKGVKGSCECYEAKENRWVPGPALHEPRCSLSACLVSGCIYLFGGWNACCLSGIELLDLNAGSKCWEPVKLWKDQSLPPLQIPGVAPVRDNKVIIFGGYNKNGQASTECFILNTKSQILKPIKGIKEGDGFVGSESRVAGDYVYAFGYVRGGVHVYDIDNNEWEFIPQMQLVPQT